MKTWRLGRCGVAIATLAAVSAAEAALLDYDGFDYPGQTTIGGLAGGIGWGGAWVNTTGEPALTGDGQSLESAPFPFTPVGERLRRVQGTTGDRAAIRDLSQPFDLAGDGVLYASTLVRRGDDGDAISASDMQFQFRTNGGTIGFRFGVSAADVFFVGANAVDTNSGAVPIVEDTVYFLVVKIVSSAAGSDEVFMNVYAPGDTVPQSEPGSWDLATSGARNDLITQLRINIGTNNSYGEIDEIRIGTDWASVAVPEPASLAVMGVGALAVRAVRRRRRC